jgi:hypothetical protein
MDLAPKGKALIGRLAERGDHDSLSAIAIIEELIRVTNTQEAVMAFQDSLMESATDMVKEAASTLGCPGEPTDEASWIRIPTKDIPLAIAMFAQA